MAKRVMDQYKKKAALLMALGMVMTVATGCSKVNEQNSSNNTDRTTNMVDVTKTPEAEDPDADSFEDTTLELSDAQILINGETVSTDKSSAVYVGADIVYYEEGKDDTYGEGSEEEAHSAEEAAKHSVITITQPGEYRVTGKISYGQIAIDLGEDAKEDPNAVVTLILDNADLTCTVAPAIVVYHAYECGSDETDSATSEVDTTNAGFNLVLADDSVNQVSGCHVAKIYQEGTTDKLYKFDAAIDSKVSYNINGQTSGNGQLTVHSDNEGISSDLHMTINGGVITINASDDSINTNEDGVSVFTMNDGVLTCDSGNGTEGDGIDSNGWIVINGGFLISSANATSQDSGLDSDNGIFLNGGTVLASGNMYDEVSSDSAQNFVVLNFTDKQREQDYVLIKDSDGNAVIAFHAVNDYTMLVYSSPEIAEGDYTMYQVSSVEGDRNGSIYTNITSYEGEQQLQYTSNSMMGMGGGMGRPGEQMPTDGEAPEMPAGGQAPEMPADGQAPEKPADGQAPEKPADGQAPEMPADGQQPEIPNGGQMPSSDQATGEPSTVFTITEGNSTFGGISTVSE